MGMESKDGIADIIVMRYLAFIEQNNILQLTGIADNAALSDQRLPADERTLANFRVLINNAGTCNISRIEHDCTFGNPDVLSALFETIFRKSFSDCQNDFFNVRERFPGIGVLLQIIPGNTLVKINQLFQQFWFKFVFLFVLLFVLMYVILVIVRSKRRKKYRKVNRRRHL